ncbi:MAG: HAMP domain-containing protein, partial [Planctomycetes bacterium]|nr:HAMP domain-containing protein [Planctomycetota bacterium]
MSSVQKTDRKLRGLPVAAKLALFLAGGVAAFMIIFGFVLGRFLGDTVRDQVRRTAAEAARAASRADLDTWTRNFGTEDQGLSPQEIFDKNQKKTGFDMRLYEQDEARIAQLEWNTGRLQRFVTEGSNVLAADVTRFGPNGERLLVAASYEGGLEFAPLASSRDVTYGDAYARDGLFRAGGVSYYAIRGAAPIRDVDGKPVGEFAIYIVAGAVDEAVSSFDLAVTYAAGVFILLGTALAFVLGRIITKPLRLLQDDIRIVASGDLEHHTKPHSKDEIGELARTFDHMTRSLQEARESEREAAASRHEMAVAAEVVTLFPQHMPHVAGFDAGGLHEDPPSLGGDYYDVVEMPGGRVGFLSVAASGSGVPAAMVTSMARSFLRVVASGE